MLRMYLMIFVHIINIKRKLIKIDFRFEIPKSSWQQSQFFFLNVNEVCLFTANATMTRITKHIWIQTQ